MDTDARLHDGDPGALTATVAAPRLAAAPALGAGIPVDVDAVRRAVNRALAIRDVLPRHQELEELGAELRGHLQMLLSVVRIAGRARRATAVDQLDEGLGEGLRSAADNVRLLALDCRWALRHLTAGERSAR